MIAFLFAGLAHAVEQPCITFHSPADVVEAAMRVEGARLGGGDLESERRTLQLRLACVSDPLAPGDAAAVHLALGGERPEPMGPPEVGDAADGPPHPDGGVALVDGQAYAALRPGHAAVVQAFDAEGRVVYTRWLDASGVNDVRSGAELPTSPTLPRLPPIPLRGGEIARLVASGALVALSGGLFVMAAESRSDWYALDPSPVDNVGDLEKLRVRTNVTQGAGLACAGLGAAGLLSVAVRVPF
ncbi:MAG: hypothetical protein Q8P18_03240 [Pseudomonadota bacterium]|nr:hypothetical protein [Pseudomonadota bacterium]